jgi:hypothetical protein
MMSTYNDQARTRDIILVYGAQTLARGLAEFLETPIKQDISSEARECFWLTNMYLLM